MTEAAFPSISLMFPMFAQEALPFKKLSRMPLMDYMLLCVVLRKINEKRLRHLIWPQL